jgi:hypothetical protein
MRALGRHRGHQGLLGLLAAGLLALGGCETVQFGPDPTAPADTARGEALLALANAKRTDSGDIVFLLYKPSIHDIDAAPPTVEFEAVPYGTYRVVKVIPGRWKLGYRDEAGNLRAMPAEEDGLDEDWPVLAFAAGKRYQLLLETDEANLTVWRTDVPEAR